MERKAGSAVVKILKTCFQGPTHN